MGINIWINYFIRYCNVEFDKFHSFLLGGFDYMVKLKVELRETKMAVSCERMQETYNRHPKVFKYNMVKLDVELRN